MATAATTMTRPLTEDERDLMGHIMRWGSAGYPVRKCGSKHWTWSFRSIQGPPVVFKTKREATESFERFMDVLRELRGQEAYDRAIAESGAAS